MIERPGRISIASIVYSVLAINTVVWPAYYLYSAFRFADEHGLMPETWGKVSGNHGPWRIPFMLSSEIPLRSMVLTALSIPLYGAGLAVICALVNPGRRSLYFLVFEWSVFFTIGYGFYWLID